MSGGQFRGRLFGGRLYAGRLFAPPRAEQPPVVAPPVYSGDSTRPRPHRRDKDDDVLLFLLR